MTTNANILLQNKFPVTIKFLSKAVFQHLKGIQPNLIFRRLEKKKKSNKAFKLWAFTAQLQEKKNLTSKMHLLYLTSCFSAHLQNYCYPKNLQDSSLAKY